MPESYIQNPVDGAGKKNRTFQEVVGANTIEQDIIDLRSNATFIAVFDRIVPAANKYMASLFNTSATRIVKVWRIFSFNWQIATATGVLHEHELKKITARTAGTAVTPGALDPRDSLSAGITADHASTAVTEGSLLERFFGSSEEMKIGALTLENSLMNRNMSALAYDAFDGPNRRPITLTQNQGVTCKMITSTTAGSGSFAILFTDEPI